MSKIIIGVDPDSKAHGVAVYKDGRLIHLKSMPLTELMCVFRQYEHQNPVVHIENVCGNSSSSFHHKSREPTAVKAKKSENVGMCKQAQKEVERMAEYYGIAIVQHKISKSWKCQGSTRQFELSTGWKLQSNEDTRSAAYFGFLGCQK